MCIRDSPLLDTSKEIFKKSPLPLQLPSLCINTCLLYTSISLQITATAVVLPCDCFIASVKFSTLCQPDKTRIQNKRLGQKYRKVLRVPASKCRHSFTPLVSTFRQYSLLLPCYEHVHKLSVYVYNLHICS